MQYAGCAACLQVRTAAMVAGPMESSSIAEISMIQPEKSIDHNIALYIFPVLGRGAEINARYCSAEVVRLPHRACATTALSIRNRALWFYNENKVVLTNGGMKYVNLLLVLASSTKTE